MSIHTCPLPAAPADLRQLISSELDRLDPDDALYALEELYETYDLHVVEDGVPADLHDSIFTLHKTFRVIILATKKIKEVQ